jgi:hypothetical protein
MIKIKHAKITPMVFIIRKSSPQLLNAKNSAAIFEQSFELIYAKYATE